MSYASPYFYIVAIVLIAVVGGGFIWAYEAETPQPEYQPPALHQPTVLGAATGEPIIQPLAAESAPLEQADLIPSQVNVEYLSYCHRPARLAELDQWSGQPTLRLRAHLANPTACK